MYNFFLLKIPISSFHLTELNSPLTSHLPTGVLWSPHLTEHGRALVRGDLVVGVHPDRQVVGERLGLPQRVGVAEVDHVVAPVGPRPDDVGSLRGTVDSQ